MHETSDFLYTIYILYIYIYYTKSFVHSYTVDVAFTLSYSFRHANEERNSYWNCRTLHIVALVALYTERHFTQLWTLECVIF